MWYIHLLDDFTWTIRECLRFLIVSVGELIIPKFFKISNLCTQLNPSLYSFVSKFPNIIQCSERQRSPSCFISACRLSPGCLLPLQYVVLLATVVRSRLRHAPDTCGRRNWADTLIFISLSWWWFSFGLQMMQDAVAPWLSFRTNCNHHNFRSLGRDVK